MQLSFVSVRSRFFTGNLLRRCPCLLKRQLISHATLAYTVIAVYAAYIQKEGVVDVVLSNTAGVPIYVQIEDQIKAAILRGELSEGEALPSIRALARDLRVSVITTTRAYAELVADGLVANVPGKGYFVLPRDAELVREQVLREVETHFADGVAAARLADIDDDEIRTILELALKTGEDI